MKINDIFEKVKEKASFMFGLDKISIDPAFFSRFDDEFKKSEPFAAFMNKTGNNLTYVDDKQLSHSIQAITETYFVFLRAKFEDLSLDEQVNLAAEEFFKHLSYYRGSKLHGVLDGVKKDLLMSDLDTLFNGDYYADVVFTIGSHFQMIITLKDIQSKLKKEVERLRDTQKASHIIREQHCFKYMTCVDSIFKVKSLKTAIKELKVKHGIIEVKEKL